MQLRFCPLPDVFKPIPQSNFVGGLHIGAISPYLMCKFDIQPGGARSQAKADAFIGNSGRQVQGLGPIYEVVALLLQQRFDLRRISQPIARQPSGLQTALDCVEKKEISALCLL